MKQTTLADLNTVGLLRDLKKDFERFWTDLFGGEYDNTHPQGKIWDFIEHAVDKALKQQRAEVLEETTLEICRFLESNYGWDYRHAVEGWYERRYGSLYQLNTPSGDTKLEIKEESK